MRFAKLVTTAVTAGLLGLPVVALTATPAAASGTFQTRVTMQRSPAAQLYGATILVAGKLEAYNYSSPNDWAPINDGEILKLERRRAGSSNWVMVDDAAEDSNGQVVFTTTAVQNASYRVTYAGGIFQNDSTTVFAPSAAAAQGVKVARDLNADRKQVNGPKFRFFGKVKPTYARKKIVLQRKQGGGGWKTIDEARTSRRGGWSFIVYALRKKGVVRYRTFTPKDTKFIRSYSAEFKITTF